MSGIDPSTNRDTASTDTVGGPTAGDKYDDSRHLNYGQSKSSKSEDLGSPCPVPIRRHSISSDSKPVSMHTFQEQITGGMTGDDIIKMEEKKEKQRKEKEKEQSQKRKKT